MDLVTIIRILYRKILFLVGIPFAVIIMTFILTSGYKQIFKSTAQISTGFTISQEVNVTAQRFNLYEADVKFSNLIETMQSARVLSLLSYRLLLHDLESPDKNRFYKPVIEDEEKRKFLKELDTEAMIELCKNKLDSMLILNTHKPNEENLSKLLEIYKYNYNKLGEMINIKRIKNTDYVSIDAFSEDPILSAYIVNTLCAEFLRFNNKLAYTRKNNTVETFAKLLEEKRKELDKASQTLQNFKANNSMFSFEAERENKLSRVSELQTELQNERKNNRAISLQLRDISRQLLGLDDVANITNSDVVRIKKQINQVNNLYRESGFKDQKLKDSLDILRATQQRYIRVVSQGSSGTSYEQLNAKKRELEVSLEISNQNINALEQNLGRANYEVGGYASNEARIAALEREVNLTSEDYREAQEKYSQALNVSLASDSNVTQTLLGLPATDPEPSKRLIVTAMSGASTFVMIILAIILLEYLDVSIKNRSNFSKTIDLPLLGVLNHVNLKKGSILEVFDHEKGLKNKDYVIFRDQLRKLRYQLLNAEKKTILFTSTKSEEGKSLVIQAMCLAMSQSLKKVLIIDTNFAHNSLTTEMKATTDLEEVLTTNKVISSSIAKPTEMPGIDIVGCAGGDLSPVEIIKGETMNNLLEKMTKKYDFIFFEGASLNGNSDSRELSDFVDGVITVFSAKSILGELDQDSINYLKSLEEKNIGAILNDVEINNMAS